MKLSCHISMVDPAISAAAMTYASKAGLPNGQPNRQSSKATAANAMAALISAMPCSKRPSAGSARWKGAASPIHAAASTAAAQANSKVLRNSRREPTGDSVRPACPASGFKPDPIWGKVAEMVALLWFDSYLRLKLRIYTVGPETSNSRLRATKRPALVVSDLFSVQAQRGLPQSDLSFPAVARTSASNFLRAR